jgi:iron complex outermembrane recepter protein
MKYWRYVVNVVVGCAIIFGAGAEAQEESPTGAAALEEIVVTARKRAEGLQDVPISLAVVSGDVVDRMGLYRFEDLGNVVANLHIDEGLASPAINIRGLGSGTSNLAFEQSVGLFVDGVYSGRSHLFELALFDVAQVEVVRGPQGALFGKNTNAGAISVTTRKPTDQFEASLRAAYEFEREGYDFEGIVSGPVSEALSLRLASKLYREGGYIRNLATGKDDPEEDGWVARLTGVLAPGGNWDATLKLEGAGINTDGGWFQMTDFGTAVLSDVFRATDPNAEDTLDEFRSSLGLYPERNDTNAASGTLTINWDIGGFTLTSLTAHTDFDYTKFVEFTGTSLRIAGTRIWEDTSQFSQELRLASPADRPIDYVIGALYLDSDLFSRQITDVMQFGPFTGDSDRIYDQTDTSWSVFASGNWHATDALRFNAALRYTSEEKKGHARHIPSGFVFPTWLPYDLSGKRTETSWTPSASVQFDVNPQLMLYGAYATGSKAGGFLSNDSALGFRILNGTSDFEYQDESAESFEVGLKATLLDGRGTVNLALFTSDFEDLQTSNFNGQFIVTANAAKARARGVEAEAAFRLSAPLRLSVAAAYLDAKYLSYPDGQCLFGATAADGCNVATGTMDLSGVRLERAPEWTGSIVLDFSQPFADSLSLGAQIMATYQSEIFLQPDLDPHDSVGEYTKINARVSLGHASGRWEFAVVGRNITDKIVKNFAFDTPFFGGGAHTASISPRRTVAAEVAYRF